MKIKASDLIKRAQQLADLENSSFVSWKENTSLLNENFNNLYQKVINAGEKYFLKEIKLTDGERNGAKTFYKLPDDFYQLYSINETGTNRAILRKSQNDSFTTSSYDIIGDNLVIYGAMLQGFTIQYYPIAQNITIPTPDYPFSYESNNNEYKDIYNSLMYEVKAELPSNEIELTVNNIATGESINEVMIFEEENFDAIYKVVAFSSGALIFLGSENTEKVIKYHGNTREYQLIEDENIEDKHLFLNFMKDNIVLDNGVLFSLDKYGKKNFIKLVNDKDNLESIYGLNSYIFGAWNEDYSKLYYCINNATNISVYDLETDEINPYVYSLNMPCNYLIGNFAVFDNYILSFDFTKNFNSTIGINKLDKTTGYGITTKENVIKSYFEDTLIDIPNNLFIQMLSYMIAISYKSKQNAPIDTLSVLYQRAEEQFYDTLTNDANGFVRIKNDY